MMEGPLILMNLRELWTAFSTHNWKESKNELHQKKAIDEEELPQHSGLIISAEDQYLAFSHPYIKIRVKTQKGNFGEPDEIIEVEKDIIITSTKQEVNQLKKEAIDKEKAIEMARNVKAAEVKNRVKDIGKKKEPTDIRRTEVSFSFSNPRMSNIIPSGFIKPSHDAINMSDMTTRVQSGRETELFPPLKSEERNKSEHRGSKFGIKRYRALF